MYEQETSGVMVRVEPQFLPEESSPDEGRFVWAYTIEIENRSPESVQLVSRFWRITDENGLTQEVRGAGVIGQQPTIPPGESFRYTSAAPLAAPSGVMSGAYSRLPNSCCRNINMLMKSRYSCSAPMMAAFPSHS